MNSINNNNRTYMESGLLPLNKLKTTMKLQVLVFILFSLSSIANAQVPTATKNFILESTIKIGNKINESELDGLNINEIGSSVQYIDGFGRALQVINIQASPQANDIVQPIAYDDLGRERFKFLPYVASSNAGQFKVNATTEGIYGFYNPIGTPMSDGVTRITSPYSESVFESSPLNRIIEQGAPGNDWQINNGHTLKNVYAFNNSDTEYAVNGFACLKYRSNVVNITGQEHQRTLSNSNFYEPNELYITIKKDENWVLADGKAGTVEEYKDKNGAIVLKRVFNKKPDNTIEVLSTYYVYDDFGSLSYVLPPGANPDGGLISQSTLDSYCYQYYYDSRGRPIEKKIPGKGWEYAVYNTLDQLVLTQDANQRAKSQKEWNIIKYDAFGRVVITALVQDNRSRADLQDVINNIALNNLPLWEQRDNANSTGNFTGYTNTVMPTLNILSYNQINYFDSYDFYGNNFGAPIGSGQVNGNRVKSLPIAFKVNVIGPNGAQRSAQNMLLHINYYDNEGRILQSKAQNHLGGTDLIENTYSFIGDILTTIRTHTGALPSVTTKITNEYVYDHVGRNTKTYEQIQTNSTIGERILLSENIYNEIGQLKEKRLHSTNAGQPSASNIVLNAANIVQTGLAKVVTASSSIILEPGFEAKQGSVFHASISDGVSLQVTRYAYNDRGWLKSSNSNQFSLQLNYNDPIGGAVPYYNGNVSNQLWDYSNNPTLNTFSYNYDKLDRLTSASSPNLSESILYDQMGNIKSLYREGKGTNNYTGYNGHQLTHVQGFTTGDYVYDLNGNLISDSEKNINISYNSLGLPSQITGSQNITYLYDATGNKLQKQTSSAIIDYVSGIQYKNNGASIDIILTKEGVARNLGGGNYSYEYTLSDHLGNSRVNFYKDPNTSQLSVLQRDNYYAFGLRQPKQLSSNDNKYLYNGKELQDELEEYDYGARFYNPVLARWSAVDPLAEKMRSFSTYSYAFNNPISFTDPDGMMPSTSPGMLFPIPTSTADMKEIGMAAIRFLEDVSMLTTWKESMENIQGYVLNTLHYGMNRGRGYEAMLRSGNDPELIDVEYKLNDAVYKAKMLKNAMEWAVFAASSGEMAVSASIIKAPVKEVVKEVAKEVVEKEIVKFTETKVAKEGSTALNKFYPKNDGFVGVTERTFLMPGQEISRFGSNSGKFFSPVGTPLPMRALPPGANTNIHNTFKVLKPFEVQVGKIAPAFGQPGFGTQYLSPVSADVLLKWGIIGY